MLKIIPFKLRYFAVLFAFSVIILTFVLSDVPAASVESISHSIVAERHGPLLDEDASIETATADVERKVVESLEQNITHTVKKGDTLYSILNGNGISAADVAKIAKSMKRSGITTVLHIREVVDIYIDSKGELEKVFIYGNPKGNAAITPNNSLFVAQLQPIETTKEFVSVAASISSSFYNDALKAGASNNIVKSFINNFSSVVNFQRDIKAGDSFEIRYEIEKSKDGKIVKYGPMQYGSIIVKGTKYQIYRYANANGSSTYVDASGVPIKRVAFRKPVKETRISSKFGYRKHPVTGKRRMHSGVDYAAPSGTKIVAAADGVIEFVKVSRTGYGKHVKIKHNGTYSTLYGHMLKFGKGIKRGTRVKQGQVIGYVGKTGTATGNHLHFELHKKGIKINPLKVTFAEPSTKLAENDMKRFLAQKKDIDKKFKLS